MIRIVAILGMLTLLTGCFQVEMKIDIISAEEGQATSTITLARETYDAISASANGNSENKFCKDGETTLTETSAVCVTVNGGSLDELALDTSGDGNEPSPVTILDDGTVRVAMPLGELAKNAPQDMPMDDPQAQAMIKQMLLGSKFTFIVSGKKIIDTNMTLSEDGKTATFTTETIKIILQDETMPEEFYAIVDPN